MENEEVVKMLNELDDAIRLANSLVDALLANKIKVHLGLIMQDHMFDGTQPIISSNIKDLIKKYDTEQFIKVEGGI